MKRDASQRPAVCNGQSTQVVTSMSQALLTPRTYPEGVSPA